ncbi:MAG: Y-family DNA polymerase [Prolixibacteraceae bacterium]|nr:Y-family DNA polymerase [Prolixibacteraceae bacterium]MBN2650041.1 Y-family DNA polymerase [Prolixibacteraceae bacterium]
MFALVDCNNFYASCERLFRPWLNGRPVVVLSNNDGCVIARSNEAKALGIPMGAPAFKYNELFQKNGVAVFSSNYALYGDLSSRVMSILSEMAPEIEVYSIDEAFLQFDNCYRINFQQHGKAMRDKVLRNTGIPTSVGFAPTKALAKLANRIAKKFPDRTGGVYVIDTDEKRLKALQWLDIEDVWGIGRRYSKRLRACGVNTAYDFVQQPGNWVKKNFSVVGLRLKYELEGRKTLPVEETVPRKNIATTRSFERMYTQLDELNERVVTFAVSCAEKLRKQNSCCRTIMVFIHTNGFRSDLQQYSQNIVIKLPFASNSGIELANFARLGLQKIFREGYQYKKAGVIVMDLVSEHELQLNIFKNSDPRHRMLMKAVDELNHEMGQQKVRLASQSPGRTWKMRQEKLSQRYTTRLSEVFSVRSG